MIVRNPPVDGFGNNIESSCCQEDGYACGPFVDQEREIDELRRALGDVFQWWEALPSNLRQDIEGSGAMPGCIARAQRLAACESSTE